MTSGSVFTENMLSALEELIREIDESANNNQNLSILTRNFYLTLCGEIIAHATEKASFDLLLKTPPYIPLQLSSFSSQNLSRKLIKTNYGDIAIICAVSGYGLVGLYSKMGMTDAIICDSQINPSVFQILQVLDSSKADLFILFPNSQNCVAVASQAIQFFKGQVEIVPTYSQAHGIYCLQELDIENWRTSYIDKMKIIANKVHTIELRISPVEFQFGEVHVEKSTPIVFFDNQLISAGDDFGKAFLDIIKSFHVNSANIFTGKDVNNAYRSIDVIDKIIKRYFPKINLNVIPSGNPSFIYLLSFLE
jgi:dihydroxyacetone kinase-like predicted kinase